MRTRVMKIKNNKKKGLLGLTGLSLYDRVRPVEPLAGTYRRHDELMGACRQTHHRAAVRLNTMIYAKPRPGSGEAERLRSSNRSRLTVPRAEGRRFMNDNNRYGGGNGQKRPLDGPLTIDAAIHDDVMALPPGRAARRARSTAMRGTREALRPRGIDDETPLTSGRPEKSPNAKWERPSDGPGDSTAQAWLVSRREDAPNPTRSCSTR